MRISRYCCNAIAVAANNVRFLYDDENMIKPIFMQNIIFD